MCFFVSKAYTKQVSKASKDSSSSDMCSLITREFSLVFCVVQRERRKMMQEEASPDSPGGGISETVFYVQVEVYEEILFFCARLEGF